METTRHFTATVYVVNDGATALHHHDRLGIRVPPGGHVDRDELPHEAGLREVQEEMGLEATLLSAAPSLELPNGRPLPEPQYQLLYDIDVVDGRVVHQHIDHVYFATVPGRDVDPAGTDEKAAAAWDWYEQSELRAGDFDPDVVRIGTEAIEAAARSPVAD
jgi:8-oxo-dGTP pyrophosphatase MutT (NUDIX family)